MGRYWGFQSCLKCVLITMSLAAPSFAQPGPSPQFSAGMWEMATSRLRFQVKEGTIGDRSIVHKWMTALLTTDASKPLGNSISEAKLFSCYPELDDYVLQGRAVIAERTERENEKRNQKRKAEEGDRALMTKPSYVLTKTYYEYVFLKKCFERRKGYAQVNVTEVELERARTAASSIEKKLIDAQPDLNKDDLWKIANGDPSAWQVGQDKGLYSEEAAQLLNERFVCQAALGGLERRHRDMVPAANEVRKDF